MSKNAATADRQRERVEQELASIGVTRSVAEVTAELAPYLADKRLACDTWLPSVALRMRCIEVVAPLKQALGRAERREKLGAKLATLASDSSAIHVRAADPGAQALSVYLAALGITVATATLTDN